MKEIKTRGPHLLGAMMQTALVLATLVLALSCSSSDKSEDDMTNLLMLGMVSDPAKIKFINGLSTTETYSIHTTSGCTNAATMTWGSVAGGAETTTRSLTGSLVTFFISYNAPANTNCTQSSINFMAGTILSPAVYTCRSSTTAISCAKSGSSSQELLK